MPRDFVPVLYHEWEMYDERSQRWQRRYEATEAFAMVDRETREPLLTLTGDSHAFHVGHTQGGLPALVQPPLSQVQIEADRTRLFETFYAAMEALE